MTPYYRLPLWWQFCDDIRKDMNDYAPRVILADYVDENGHHDLANGIRDAWREGLVYEDEHSVDGVRESWMPRSRSLHVSYNRGFVHHISSTSLPHVRSILSQLVRANIVLAVVVGVQPRKVRKNYKWYFDDAKHNRAYTGYLPMHLQQYVSTKHETEGKAYDSFSRGMIEQAIEKNCDGTEGMFMNREIGIKRLMGKLGRHSPLVRNAIIAGVYGAKMGDAFMEVTSRSPFVPVPSPTDPSASPSVDPACIGQPD